jgi:hypothetical protein
LEVATMIDINIDMSEVEQLAGQFGKVAENMPAAIYTRKWTPYIHGVSSAYARMIFS